MIAFVSGPMILAVETINPEWHVADVVQGTKPSFDFDSQNRIHMMGMMEAFPGVVWHSVAENGLGEWKTTLLASGYYYGPGDLAVGLNDEVYIAWHDHDRESPRMIVYQDSQVLVDSVIPTPAQHDGWDNSLTIDSNGDLHMASVDPSDFGAPNSLQHGVFNGSWNFDNAISGSGSFMYGMNTSVAVDDEGVVHILYSQSPDWLAPGDLRYAVKRNDFWTFSTVIGNGIRGRFPSLDIDSKGNLHASWLDMDVGNPSRAAVQYGTLAKGSDAWDIEQVDTLNNVTLGFSEARKSTSMVIDSEDRPHIAFGDDRILKYGTYEAGEWGLMTVVESDVDLYKGLAVLRLDSNDVPGIAFWNPAPGTVGVVRFAQPAAVSTFDGKVDIEIANSEAVLRWKGDESAGFTVEKSENLIEWLEAEGAFSFLEGTWEFRGPISEDGKYCYRVGEDGQ